MTRKKENTRNAGINIKLVGCARTDRPRKKPARILKKNLALPPLRIE
jgi:hypothetical protein